jgi:outer membrane PBP1 activator LpoA protein
MQISHGHRLPSIIAAVLGSVLIAGCAEAPSHQPAAAPVQQQRSTPDAAPKNPEAAAKRDARLALRSRGRARAKWQLLAAENWWRAGNVNNVKAFVHNIHAHQLDRVQHARLAALKARSELFDQHARQALQLVHMPLQHLPRRVQADILAVRGRSLFSLGDPSRAVAALVNREKRLHNPKAIARNHRMIWSGLDLSSKLQAQAQAPQAANSVVAGWLSLGTIAHRAWQQPPRQFAARVRKWQRRHPQHPANGGFLRGLLTRHRQEVAYPHKIALLLPLTGRYRTAAEAVRDGFLAERFKFSQHRAMPAVVVYDTHADPQTAVSAYRQAVRGGAALIVGPLTKQAVAAVAKQGPLATRVLALNYLRAKQSAPNAPKKLFQFGLAPEDEARAIAERLVKNGLMRGVALVPEDNWGQRMLNAFANRFRALGGTLLAFQTFQSDANDFSKPIKQVLNLTSSHQRERALAGMLSRHLSYTPRRRQDVQFIYLAAHAEAARLIRPQLRYYHAINLPVYAPSQVYNVGKDKEPDLNGVKFVDTPWTLGAKGAAPALRRTIAKLWPENFKHNNRLYALGLDAYRLVPLIHNVARPLARPVEGLTGLLTMDRQRRIHRQPDWAVFVHGQPKLLATPASIPMQPGLAAARPKAGSQP